MKRLLLPSLCALLSLASLTSCQKEDESSLNLAKMLVNELQTVVDTKTADAAAPRVAVINQRFQDAGIQVFALNGTALLRSSDRPSEYNEALTSIAREVGRIRASKPVLSYDGEIDRDALIKAVGAANSGNVKGEAQELKAGTTFYKDSIDQSHGSAGEFAPFYGSAALAEALSYEADPSTVNMFTFSDDVTPVPDAVDPADDDEEAVSDDDDVVADSDDEEVVTVDDEEVVTDDDEEVVTDDDKEVVTDDDDSTGLEIDDISVDVDDDDSSDEEETDSDDADDADDAGESSDDLDIDFGDFGI